MAQQPGTLLKYKEGTEVTAAATVKDESKYEFVNWTVDDKRSF